MSNQTIMSKSISGFDSLCVKAFAPLREQLHSFSSAVSLFFSAIKFYLVFPWRKQEISNQIVQLGIGSVPIITIATAFAGIVITKEMAWHMDLALHSVSMIPGFTSQFIIREIGIAIPALLVVAKVGAAITAEIGSMKITEQIDALKLLKISPIQYLVFPRLVATQISMLCLTLIAISVTTFCSIWVSMLNFHFNFMEYITALRHFLGPKDILCAATKALAYGTVIPIISCAYGFNCKGGAEGVGNATTNSVVASTISVIVLDFVITFLFSVVF